jgi:hypothetical protein
MKRLEALRTLLDCYLHEDWADDYPDLWHAVDHFVEGEPQSALQFRADVDQLLSQCEGEQQLQQALRALGISYYPPGGGWDSYRAWLLAVVAHVEENLHKSPAA